MTTGRVVCAPEADDSLASILNRSRPRLPHLHRHLESSSSGRAAKPTHTLELGRQLLTRTLQVGMRLQIQKARAIDAEVFAEQQRGVFADRAFALADRIDAARIDLDVLRELVLRDAGRLQPFRLQDYTRMGQGNLPCHETSRRSFKTRTAAPRRASECRARSRR